MIWPFSRFVTKSEVKKFSKDVLGTLGVYKEQIVSLQRQVDELRGPKLENYGNPIINDLSKIIQTANRETTKPKRKYKKRTPKKK
jgi:hypothetical protein